MNWSYYCCNSNSIVQSGLYSAMRETIAGGKMSLLLGLNMMQEDSLAIAMWEVCMREYRRREGVTREGPIAQ